MCRVTLLDNGEDDTSKGFWTASEWIVALAYLCGNRILQSSLAEMRLLFEKDARVPNGNDGGGDSARCGCTELEKPREKVRVGLRSRIYSKTLILPVIGRHPSKDVEILRAATADMSRVPLIEGERATGTGQSDGNNMVMLEAGVPGDTWRYCVERERLAEKSEWFRAMLIGPFAPAPSDPPPLLKLQHVEKRAFDYLLRYLQGEPISFQSVSTARATLDAAHQYLCSELAGLAVEYLKTKLNPTTVLEIYQGLGLYATYTNPALARMPHSPTAPPTPGDDAGNIAAACTSLFQGCLLVIDSDPGAVFSQERFEELTAEEVSELARRDTLSLRRESILFTALDRWAGAECRRHGVEPSSWNKRSALTDEVWYSVRYLLMGDREFIEGPMASGILSSEESAFIVARILGHPHSPEELRSSVSSPLSRLSSAPRNGMAMYEDHDCKMSKPGKKEREDNRKNRRKECANQGHKACTRIGNCLVQVLACLFD